MHCVGLLGTIPEGGDTIFVDDFAIAVPQVLQALLLSL